MTNKMPEAAKVIIDRILHDLTDRRGLKQEWNSIDSDIQREIAKKWEKIIVDYFEELPTQDQKPSDPFEHSPENPFTAPKNHKYIVEMQTHFSDSNFDTTSLSLSAPCDGLYCIDGKEKVRLKAGDPIKANKYTIEPDNDEEFMPSWDRNHIGNTNDMARDKVGIAKVELKDELEDWRCSGVWPAPDTRHRGVFDKAQNLVNAMDEYNIPEKGDSGILGYTETAEIKPEVLEALKAFTENVRAESFSTNSGVFNDLSRKLESKPKSIWKDVSELPEKHELLISFELLVKYKDGKIKLKKYLKKDFYSREFGYDFEVTEIQSFCFLTDFIDSFEHLQNKVEEMERRIKVLEDK